MSIKITVKPKYFLISCDEEAIKPEHLNECVKMMKESHELKPLVLFSFTNAKSISSGVLPVLSRVVSEIQQRNLEFALIASPKFSDFIHNQGLDRLIPCYQNLGEIVKEETGGNNASMTAEFLNTVLESVAFTMKVYLETEVKAGPAKQLKPEDPLPLIDVGSVVGILSVPFNGSLVIGFPHQTFVNAMSQFLQMEVTELTPTIRDGAAELLNVILGQAKIKLNERGYEIKQAIPTVISGKNINVGPGSDVPSLVIPFSSGLGDFMVRINLLNNR